MKIRYVTAIFIRHMLYMYRSCDMYLELLYWPFLNIIIWGTAALWIEQQASLEHLMFMLLAGTALFQTVLKVNHTLTYCMFEDLHTQNLINLFITPLNLFEWSMAVVILTIINALIEFVFSTALVWLFFDINILTLGFHLIPFLTALILFGWSTGFFLCGLIMYRGRRISNLVYTLAMIFTPFCATTYPLESLPVWMQYIGKILPLPDIFEGMRTVIKTGTLSWHTLLPSFIMNIAYLITALLFFNAMFKRSKENGLANLV